MSDRASTPSTAARDARLEALRLVAIAGIAVFHTFQPWFDGAVEHWWGPSAPLLFALGCINLLGAFGNHVFFAASGLFLVPHAISTAGGRDHWRLQVRRAGRRALVILASVALYVALVLATDAWLTPLDSISPDDPEWLLGSLEFIWVYLVLVLLAPVVGWAWRRARRLEALVAASILVVFALNAFIAFVSPGEAERELLEWRKLMSAVTYLASFLAGGWLGMLRQRGGTTLADKATRLSGSLRGKPMWLGSPWPLFVVLALTLAIEWRAAAADNVELIAALSYKSTSLLSFALALTAINAVAGPIRGKRGADENVRREKPARSPGQGTPARSRAACLVCWLTPAILGFYIFQSLFSDLWRPPMQALTEHAIADLGELPFLLDGIAASLALLASVLVVDRIVRVPLTRLLQERLSRR